MTNVSVIVTSPPGHGKSVLLNTILSYNRFEHNMSPFPITKVAESITIKEQGMDYILWNLQGFNESKGKNADINRHSLDQAFKSAGKQLVIFLLSPNNGRLQYQDVVYFNQLKQVYGLHPLSTILFIIEPETTPSKVNWQKDFMEVFKRTTGFDVLYWELLQRLPSPIDFKGPEAQLNTEIIKQFIFDEAEPRNHVKNGDIVMEIESMNKLRDQIKQVENDINEENKRYMESMKIYELEKAKFEEKARAHVTMMDKCNSDLRGYLEYQILNTNNHQKYMNDTHAQLNEIRDIERQNNQIHQQNIATLNQLTIDLKKQHNDTLKYMEDYRATAKKKKRLGRQIEAIGKGILHHPLRAAPIVATVFIPQLAPALAPMFAGSTIAASAALGAGIGVASSALQKNGNILQGALVGGITGGAGAYVAPLSMAPTIAINAGVAATSAAITEGNIVAAIVTSTVATTLGADFKGSGYSAGDIAKISTAETVVKSIAVGAVSSVAGALVADPKNLNIALASGIVGGAISGTVSAVANNLKNTDIEPKHMDVKHKEQKASTLTSTPESTPKPQGETRDSSTVQPPERDLNANIIPPERTERDPYANMTHNQNENTNSIPATNENHNHIRTNISRNGHVSISSNGMRMSTNGTVGVTYTTSDGTTITRGVRASDIYDGIAYETTVSRPVTNTSETTTRLSSQLGSDNVISENVGACFASRTIEQRRVDDNGTHHETLITQEHFNTEGCMGNPLRAGFVATVTTMLPVTRLVTIPTAIAVSN